MHLSERLPSFFVGCIDALSDGDAAQSLFGQVFREELKPSVSHAKKSTDFVDD